MTIFPIHGTIKLEINMPRDSTNLACEQRFDGPDFLERSAEHDRRLAGADLGLNVDAVVELLAGGKGSKLGHESTAGVSAATNLRVAALRLRHQFVVRAALDDPATLQEGDLIRTSYRGQAMGNDEDDPVPIPSGRCSPIPGVRFRRPAPRWVRPV